MDCGHFQYYGIRGNFRFLEEVRRFAEKAWQYWLSRRSSKGPIEWEKLRSAARPIPYPYPGRPPSDGPYRVAQ